MCVRPRSMPARRASMLRRSAAAEPSIIQVPCPITGTGTPVQPNGRCVMICSYRLTMRRPKVPVRVTTERAWAWMCIFGTMCFIINFFGYVKNCHPCAVLRGSSVSQDEARLILMTPSKLRERIFPTAHPVIPGLDYFGDWRPARGKGADYMDYFPMNDGNLGLAVGDVGGKGVPPALLKSSLHSMIRALRYARNFSLKALVRTIDKLFSEVCPDPSYATLFIGEYEPSSGRLHYVNAGHEPPFVLRRNGAHRSEERRVGKERRC